MNFRIAHIHGIWISYIHSISEISNVQSENIVRHISIYFNACHFIFECVHNKSLLQQNITSHHYLIIAPSKWTNSSKPLIGSPYWGLAWGAGLLGQTGRGKTTTTTQVNTARQLGHTGLTRKQRRRQYKSFYLRSENQSVQAGEFMSNSMQGLPVIEWVTFEMCKNV